VKFYLGYGHRGSHSVGRSRHQPSPHPLVAVARVSSPPPGLPENSSGARYIFTDDEGELRKVLQESEIVFYWGWGIPILKAAWSDSASVRWIHSAGVGVESLQFPELLASDVVVTNCRGIYEQPMAEYALMLMLLFAKDMVHTLEDQRAHRWNRRHADALRGQQLLVVGAGSIGRAIARQARALGMRTIGVARSRREADADFEAIYPLAELLDRLPEADYVVLALPLTSATAGVMGREAFGRMKRNARLLNLGRGPLVDEAALLDALTSGRIAGAALDVYWKEPVPEDDPLWDLPNVILSPHMSGEIPGIQAAFVEIFLENLARWQAGQPLKNTVDLSLGFVPTP
jgi:phosphoglycerate dehydrogenase-like enzyme